MTASKDPSKTVAPRPVPLLLHELHIHRLGVIEQASLTVGPGLTVATGETGAGKTLVLTAIALLTGARADASLVRAGEDAAVLEAVVTPVVDASEWDVPAGQEVVISREVPADGRSRARINGRLAPASALASLLAEHVEIHAQHEHVRLARPEVQRGLVDRFAGAPHTRSLAVYDVLWARVRKLRESVASAESDSRERARELAMLRHEVAEIEAAKLDADTDPYLSETIEVLANAEDFRDAATAVSGALGDSGGAAASIENALSALQRLRVKVGPWAELIEQTDTLLVGARELASAAREMGREIDADPGQLARLQERKRLVDDLCRRFGADVVDVLKFGADAAQRMEVLALQEHDAGDLSVGLADALVELDAAAQDVRRGRKTAGKALASSVAAHLSDLAMPHASFRVDVQPATPASHGADDVRFLLAANPGEAEAELARSASGGERSRVSLAIEVALADVQDARVLVFDEVDAGIGGATALAVGEKLARLARGRQVLCVTHLPQLAAFADAHHVVEKSLAGGRTVTTVREVAEDDRVDELARMLSGETGQAGRDHASELLALARRQRSA